ncbi:hypothetical protein OC842_005555 [Tilletia horrida]|uniref:Uncharacterized protein n=1 Tax=Tilletia horrida TaxID=155126 RepID=A0AAN6JP88_9BASI|nr:hypothetical protein OC842_005555 [Tilletia horrida]
MAASPRGRSTSLSSTPPTVTSAVYRGLPYVRESLVSPADPAMISTYGSAQTMAPPHDSNTPATPRSFAAASFIGSVDDRDSLATSPTTAPPTPKDLKDFKDFKDPNALPAKHDRTSSINVSQLSSLPLPPRPLQPSPPAISFHDAATHGQSDRLRGSGAVSPSSPDDGQSANGVSKMVQHARAQTDARAWASPSQDVGSPQYPSRSLAAVESPVSGLTSQFSTRPPSLALQFFSAAASTTAHTASDQGPPEAAWEDDSSALEARSGSESAKDSSVPSRAGSKSRASEQSEVDETWTSVADSQSAGPRSGRPSRRNQSYDDYTRSMTRAHGVAPHERPARERTHGSTQSTSKLIVKGRNSDRAKELERLELAARELRAQMAAEEDERTPSDSDSGSGSSLDQHHAHGRRASKDIGPGEPVDADILALRQQIFALQQQTQKVRKKSAHSALGDFTYDDEDEDEDDDFEFERAARAPPIDILSPQRHRRQDAASVRADDSRRRGHGSQQQQQHDRPMTKAPSVISSKAPSVISSRDRAQPDLHHSHHHHGHGQHHQHHHLHADDAFAMRQRGKQPQRRMGGSVGGGGGGGGRQTPTMGHRHLDEPHSMQHSDSSDDGYPPVSSRVSAATTSRSHRRRAGPSSPPQSKGDAKLQELTHKIEMLEQIIRGTPFGAGPVDVTGFAPAHSQQQQNGSAPRPGPRISSARNPKAQPVATVQQPFRSLPSASGSTSASASASASHANAVRRLAAPPDTDEDDDLTDDWGATRRVATAAAAAAAFSLGLGLEDRRPSLMSMQGIPVVDHSLQHDHRHHHHAGPFRPANSAENMRESYGRRRSQYGGPPGLMNGGDIGRGVAMKRSVSPAATIASAFQFNATPAATTPAAEDSFSSAHGHGHNHHPQQPQGKKGGGGLRTLFGVGSSGAGSASGPLSGTQQQQQQQQHHVKFSHSSTALVSGPGAPDTRSIRSGDGQPQQQQQQQQTVLLSFSRKRTERVEIPKAKIKQAAGRGRVYVTPVKPAGG